MPARSMRGVVTHVIDKNGQWRANFNGLNFKPIDDMVVFINALAKDAPHAHPPKPESVWEKLKSML
jgi:protein SCO1/2